LKLILEYQQKAPNKKIAKNDLHNIESVGDKESDLPSTPEVLINSMATLRIAIFFRCWFFILRLVRFCHS